MTTKPQPARDIDVLTQPDTSKQGWEETVAEIMQSGFDVAMGGDLFKTEEENREWQDVEFAKAVKKHASFIQQEIDRAVGEATKKTLNEFDRMIDTKFPPRFIEETSYGHGVLKRGVQEHTYVRRTNIDDENFLEFLDEIRSKIEKGEKHE